MSISESANRTPLSGEAPGAFSVSVASKGFSGGVGPLEATVRVCPGSVHGSVDMLMRGKLPQAAEVAGKTEQERLRIWMDRLRPGAHEEGLRFTV